MKTEDYTKEQLHSAFTREYYAHKQTQDVLHAAQRENASLRFERDRYKDHWLRLHIEKHVKIVGDMDEALDAFFSHKQHMTFFTPSGGYYCVIDNGDHLFILFAWGNVKEYKREIKDMKELIYNISTYAAPKPIRYTGINNYMKNHSVEVEPGLFELRL